MKYDCVVIGAGVSGLTAALFLAEHHKRVALVEQAPAIGPLLTRFKRGGAWCDPGFHYTGGLQPSEPLAAMLAYLGILDKLTILPLDTNGFDVLSLDGENEIRIPNGFERVADTLCSRFPGSAKAVRAYLDEIERLTGETSFTNLSQPFGKTPGDIDPGRSLRDFLVENRASEDLIELLGRHGQLLYGVAGEEVPLHVHAYAMGSYYRSACTLRNGGDGLIGAFRVRLEEEGVELRLRQRATRLLVDDRKAVSGVRTADGEVLECGACISTIHPQLLTGLLPMERLRPAFINRLKRSENTGAPFVAFFDLEHVPEKIARSNYYHFLPSGEAGKNGDPIAFMAASPDADPRQKKSLCVIQPCADELFASHLASPDAEHDAAYSELSSSLLEKIVRRMRAVFPELNGKTKLLETATPVTYQRYTGTVGGSIYGIKQTVRHRPFGTLTPVHNLFLAGQSILPGVMGSVVSSFLAAGNLVPPEHFWSDLQKC